MENQPIEEELEKSTDSQTKGFLSRTRHFLSDLLAGENGRRIATIGGVILLVIVVIVAIGAIYPKSQNLH